MLLFVFVYSISYYTKLSRPVLAGVLGIEVVEVEQAFCDLFVFLPLRRLQAWLIESVHFDHSNSIS